MGGDPRRRPVAEDPAAEDTFDGWAPTDDLDEALAERDDHDGGGLDL